MQQAPTTVPLACLLLDLVRLQRLRCLRLRLGSSLRRLRLGSSLRRIRPVSSLRRVRPVGTAGTSTLNP